MGNYLIPANTKSGQLILNIFKKGEAIYCGVSFLVSFALIIAFQDYFSNTLVAIMCLLPAIVAAFLCIPVPYYHNIMTIIAEIYEFYTTSRRLKWRGWCFRDGAEKE